MSYVLSMMRDTATVQRKTVTQGAAGDKVATWANASTGNICAIQANSGREARIAGRESGINSYTGFFQYGTDVRNDDRILPDTGLAAGKVLAVKGGPIDNAGVQDHIVLTLEEVKGGGLL